LKKRNTIVSSSFYGNGQNVPTPSPEAQSGDGNMNLPAGPENMNQEVQMAESETPELTDGITEDDKT